MLLCGCTKTGRTICAEHRPTLMNDYATVKLYGGMWNNYELVYFEDKAQWYIGSTNRTTHAQTWSATGYDTKLEATKAFEEGQITYVNDAPGQS